MTTASKGLATALARASSGAVLTLAELSADDLMASLSDEQKAGLSASLPASNPPAASASEDGDEDDVGGDTDATCSKCKEPMKDGKCAKCEASASAEASDPVAAARAEERSRYTTVMASEHYQGREQLAQSMLANDKLSASEIVSMLATAPKTTASASEGDAGAGAVLEAIRSSNAALESSASNIPAQAANHGWGDIHAELRERRSGTR